MQTEFKALRTRAGHTQQEAAAYIYSSVRTIRRIEAGEEDKARTELYRLKLEKQELHK